MKPIHRAWMRAISLIVLACLALSGCTSGESGAYVPLTAEQPFAQLAEGLTLSINPAALQGDFAVQMRAFTAEALSSEATSDADLAAGRAALQAKPAALTLVGPLFTLRSQGTPPQPFFLSLIAPAGSEATRLDLYAWDGSNWSFLPSQARGGQRVASVLEAPQAVALFQTAPAAPLAMIRIEPADAWPLNATTSGAHILLGGVSLTAEGALGGVLPNLPPGVSDPLYPVINGDASQISSVLSDPAIRSSALQLLTAFASSGNYAGLALDIRNVAEARKDDFSAFVSGLAPQLHAQNKALLVYVNLPDELGTPTGYHLRALGASADALVARLPLKPTALNDGTADAALVWASGEVQRAQLRVATSALPVSAGPNGYGLLSNYSLEGWNSVQAPDADAPLQPNASVTLDLFNPFEAEAQSGALKITAPEGTLWLTTPATLRQRFALAEKYGLGGVVAEDVFHAGVPVDMLTAVADYQASAPTTQSDASLVWTVSDASGVVAQTTSRPGEPYVFVPEAAGEYQVSAQFKVGTHTSDLGSVPVKVAEVLPTATPAPTSRPATGGNTGNPSNPGSGNPGSNPTPRPPTGGGGFVPPPAIPAGSFELGGQVPGFIAHAAQMKQAKMSWVKFQAIGDVGGAIGAGHSNGFKVLISAVGDRSRAADPAYWPEYASWVASIAAQGADAIEVWNEANLDREWPTGQISGTTYTELLKQAYTAIKAANPGTLVISGAPAPTGAEAAFPGRVMNDNNFLAQMAAAGAASYMDCVGVHYNEGVVSPTQSSGDPRDSFYSRYYSSMVDLYYGAFQGSRQLCFTELGYLTGEGYGPLPSFFAWAGDNTVAEQAQWLAEAASLSGRSGKVRMMIVFNVDFTHWSDDPQAGYAILRPDGSCPACASLGAVMP